MTTAEGDRFRAALAVERNDDQLDAYSMCVTSIANPTCVETPVRLYAGSKKATSGPASRAVNISTRKRLAAVPWAPFCRRCQEALDGHSGGIQSPTGDLLGRAA